MKMLNDRFIVELVDDRILELTSIPYDYSLYSKTARKHGWGTSSDDPAGALLFVTWAAARRVELIDRALAYEAYEQLVVSIEKLEPEPVDPTVPVPGTG